MTTDLGELKSAIVGIDFSGSSKQALKAAAFLQNSGALKVSAHHTVDTHGIDELADALSVEKRELIEELREKGKERLEDWSTEIGFVPGPTYSSSIGDPAKELIALGEAHDLLILGERGESHPGRGVGSVAVQCVRKSKGRVLLVNHEGETVRFEKMVACVDFSAASSIVVREAVRLAEAYGAQVEFLHVYRAPWDRLHYRAPTAEASPHFRREYLEMLQRQMDDCLTGVDYELHETVLHRSSSYGYGIADYVRQSHADLVVLGTHGRSTLKELYLGSTAERLLRELPCSVMTVRTG